MKRNKRSVEEEEEEQTKSTEQPQESSESDGDEDEGEVSGQDETEASDDDGDEEDSVDEKEIQVEFEAYPTQESDFHGVKKLLGQLFLKAKIDLTHLTETIIAQSDTSFVIQQADSLEGEDDDDEEIDQEVYGISAMVNVSSNGVKSIDELRKFLLSKCNNAKNVDKLREILHNPSKHSVGWIVNERFINLSPKIALPCLKNLYSEVKKPDTEYPFEWFIFIIKLLKSTGPISKRKQKKLKKSNDGDTSTSQVIETIYQNPEEEIIHDSAEEFVEWNVSEQCDSDARGGNWDEEDVKYTPWRRIVLLSCKSFQRALSYLEAELNAQDSSSSSSPSSAAAAAVASTS